MLAIYCKHVPAVYNNPREVLKLNVAERAVGVQQAVEAPDLFRAALNFMELLLDLLNCLCEVLDRLLVVL